VTAVIRIVKSRTLAGLRAEAAKAPGLEKAASRAEAELAALWARHNELRQDFDNLRTTHDTVKRQARDWEWNYNATVNSIGAWVNEVRAKIADPTMGSDFQRDLAVGLWRAWLEKAEAAGDDAFTVRLLKTLLGLDAQTDDCEQAATARQIAEQIAADAQAAADSGRGWEVG
jgi:hypothetical protein